MAEPTKTYRSLAELFFTRVAETPDADAFLHPLDDGGWGHLTWRQAAERVRTLACGLRALGLGDEDRVAILSSTRLEWILIDLAILCAGCATTTIYPSNTPDECAFIANDSGSRVVIAENAQQLAKLKARRGELRGVEHVVLIDGAGDGDWALDWSTLLALGQKYDTSNPGRLDDIVRAIGPERMATLIYTSGTTGRPKGVELTHDCWLYEGEAIEALDMINQTDIVYLWLPLSHAFGKVIEVAQLRIGFVTPVDGRVDRLVDNMATLRPTVVPAVPRIFEKVHNKVVTGALDKGGLTLRIFRWAITVGQRYAALARAGRTPPVGLRLEHRIADRLVFSKVRARFGGRLRYFISGSAPLSREVAEFFHAAGLLIVEGYGLTETSAASFVNRLTQFKFGSVGPPLPGTDVRIAPDGEVLIRGRGVMRGYHQLPEATREVLEGGNGERWLHTGDIGELDADGFLRITDRKKDLIKTSGGKYVAPQAVEGKLKAVSPWVSQVLVHGNNRNFVTALITLDEEAVRSWAREHGLGDVPWEQLVHRDEVRRLVQHDVDEVNRNLASYEAIKKFALLARDFTQEAGELTASLKVKRKLVEERYKPLLDDFYSGATLTL